MTNVEIIEQIENTIGLIKQNGKDWLDDRDIPILEVCIKELTALDKIKAEIEHDMREAPYMYDDEHLDELYSYQDGLEHTLNIIDKYRAEREE